MSSEFTMTCISPPELDDQQLAAYLDGTADKSTVEHIKRCAYCRLRSQEVSRWQERLSSRLFRSTCPPSLDLGEYQLGLLAGARAMAMAKHIHECPHCASEVQQLKDFLRDDDTERKPSPATQVGHDVKRYLEDLVGVVIGTVQPRAQSGLAALRGVIPGPIVVEAGDVQILLSVQPATDGRLTLLGQLVIDDVEPWIGAEVELWQVDEPRRANSVDDIGTFHIEGLLAAPAELLVTSSSGRAISVPALDLRP